MRVKRIGEHDLPLPQVKDLKDAGIDLRCSGDFEIYPGERLTVGTGFAWEFTDGMYGRVSPRSGLAVKYGIDVLAGVIDCGYRGEVKVVLINHGSHTVPFRKGDRIAQMVIGIVMLPDFISEADSLTLTNREADGFGSSGLE